MTRSLPVPTLTVVPPLTLPFFLLFRSVTRQDSPPYDPRPGPFLCCFDRLSAELVERRAVMLTFSCTCDQDFIGSCFDQHPAPYFRSTETWKPAVPVPVVAASAMGPTPLVAPGTAGQVTAPTRDGGQLRQPPLWQQRMAAPAVAAMRPAVHAAAGGSAAAPPMPMAGESGPTRNNRRRICQWNQPKYQELPNQHNVSCAWIGNAASG